MAVSEKYDQTTISLHWITAGLVVVLWIIGQTADWLPDGPLNTDYWSIHVVLGFALVAVIAWRVIWRNSGGNRLHAADTGVLQVVAQATHYGLYLLLLAVVVLGIINAFVRGYNLFDLVSLPQIGDRPCANQLPIGTVLPRTSCWYWRVSTPRLRCSTTISFETACWGAWSRRAILDEGGTIGVNDLGEIVGFFTDAAGDQHGYMDKGGVFTSFDPPGSGSTTINGVNNLGDIAGFNTSPTADAVIGFVGTPVPEPSTWAMMLVGFAGLGFLGYRKVRHGNLPA